MIISIVILILLSFGVLLGIKRGFTYQLIKMVGIFLILILSYLLKDLIAEIFIKYFDFIKIDKSISIIFYRMLSFIILCFIFRLILQLLLRISKTFENILKATVILSIPSKILGGILGFIEYYIYIFIILLVLNLPFMPIDIGKSKIASSMINGTPLMSENLDMTLFEDLKEVVDSKGNTEDYLEVLIKHGIINRKESMKILEKNT